MKVRSTENSHAFTKKLFSKINAYDIQGLTINHSKTDFLVGLEALELEENEEFNFSLLKKAFPINEIFAKSLLCDKLKIPFYVLTSKNGLFDVYKINRNKDFNVVQSFQFATKEALNIVQIEKNMDEKQFISWWRKIKKTTQNKPFINGAGERASKTIFDSTLAKDNLLWGGNLDGFIIKDNKIVGIVDNLSAGSDITKYNPAEKDWFTVWILHINSVLAKTLNVPHFIFTIDKYHPNEEVIGLCAVDTLYLEKGGKKIKYFNDISPDKNIIRGLDNISAKINEMLEVVPAPKFEKVKKTA